MSDILKSLEGIHKQLDDNKKTPDNNVSRDVIKSDASTFDRKTNLKATLTSVEKARSVNVSTVYWETYYKVKKRFESDTKGKTKVSTPAQKAKSISQTGAAGDKKDKKGWSRLGIIAALVAGAWALGIWASNNLGPIGQFLVKLPSKLPGVAKLFAIIGRFINMLSGGKIAKFFTGLGKVFMGMIGSMGKIGKTVTTLFKGSKIISILKGLVKGIGSKIAKYLRFIPFLGSVISFAYAYSKFKKGKYIGAMFELISGIANMLPGGQVVSLIIDGAILLYDLWATKKESSKKSVDGKKKKGFLGMLKDKMVAGFMAVLPYLPVFGTIYHLADAWGAFKGGDITGALLSIGKGILVFLPGGGLILKGLEVLTSFIAGKREEKGSKIGAYFNFLGMLKDKMVAGFMATLPYLPVFGTIYHLKDAWTAFKGGDIKGALLSIGKGVLVSLPIGGLLLKGLEVLTSFIDGKREKDGSKIGSGINFLVMIKDKVVAGLKTTLRYLPLFGGLFYMGDAVACFKSGDLVGGLKNIGLSIIGSIGGKGLVDGIMWVSSLLTTATASLPKLNIPKFDFIKKVFTKIKNVVGDVIKSIWNWVKSKFTNVIKGVAKWIPKWVPGRAALMKKLNGSIPDDKVTAKKPEGETIAIKAAADKAHKERLAKEAKKEKVEKKKEDLKTFAKGVTDKMAAATEAKEEKAEKRREDLKTFAKGVEEKVKAATEAKKEKVEKMKGVLATFAKGVAEKAKEMWAAKKEKAEKRKEDLKTFTKGVTEKMKAANDAEKEKVEKMKERGDGRARAARGIINFAKGVAEKAKEMWAAKKEKAEKRKEDLKTFAKGVVEKMKAAKQAKKEKAEKMKEDLKTFAKGVVEKMKAAKQAKEEKAEKKREAINTFAKGVLEKMKAAKQAKEEKAEKKREAIKTFAKGVVDGESFKVQTPEKAKVLKIDAVDKLTVRAINATSAGINNAITESNAYLRQMLDLMRRGASQGGQSATAPVVVNSGGSDNSPIHSDPAMLDSRGSYFNSPYSMNVPPVA